MRRIFWWKGLKQDIARFVAECDVSCRVKAEHLKPAGTLQPLPIPAWKWGDITMDFISGLPKTSSGYDSIWVIVDRLTKFAHFLPVKVLSSFQVCKNISCLDCLFAWDSQDNSFG